MTKLSERMSWARWSLLGLQLFVPVFSHSAPGPAAVRKQALLVTYGPSAQVEEGDDDFVQVVFFRIPAAVSGPLWLRLFDPDCSAANDTMFGSPQSDTRMRFALYGGEGSFLPEARTAFPNAANRSLGVLLKEETFDPGVVADDTWLTWAPLRPQEGAPIEGGVVFRLVVEGLSGNDGNAYDATVSLSETENVLPPGVEIFTASPTVRLEARRGTAELRFAIPAQAATVMVWTHDTAGAKLTLETPLRSVAVNHPASRLQAETRVPLEPDEAGGPGALIYYDNGRESPNDATFRLSGPTGEALFFELPIALRPPNARPQAKVQLSPLADCLSIVFDAGGSTDADGDRLSYSWSFGDGSSAEGVQVVHRYASPGRYPAQLILRDDSGWIGAGTRETFEVHVNDRPVAQIEAAAIAAPQETVAFDGSDSSDPDGRLELFSWDYGDGKEGQGARSKHQYLEPGLYTVILRVNDDSSSPCNWQTATTKVRINAPPVSVIGEDQYVSVGDPLTLDGSRSYDPDGPLTSHSWSLGDGTTHTGVTLEKTYAKSGVYRVTLEVTDGAGVSNSRASDSIRVFVNEPPVAVAGADRRLAVGEVTFFDAAGSVDRDGRIVSYDWDFGDGKQGRGARIPYAYEVPGRYAVTLRVRDDAPPVTGVNEDTLTVVVNAPPIAEAGPAQIVTASAVELDGSDSADPDGRIVEYRWDFGDGRTGTGARPVHIYTRPGTYTATLTVLDDSTTSSAQTADTVQIRVNHRPLADAGPDQIVAPGELVRLSAAGSSDPDGSLRAYEWELGDGAKGSGVEVEHRYEQPGVYTARLTVFDETGHPAAFDYDEALVTVNARPVAHDGPPVRTAPGEPVRFDGSLSYDPDGRITAHEWQFGEQEEPVLSATTERAYPLPGLYRAMLRVTDDSGASNRDGKSELLIQVNHAPIAVPGPDLFTCENILIFDGLASTDADGDPLSFEWDFGDGTRATGAKAAHIYAAGGVYPVTLTVDDGTGLSNGRHSASLAVSINRLPVAVAGADQTVCAGDIVVFDGSSSFDPDGGVLRFLWDLGDGGTSDLVSPTRIYKRGGLYRVGLAVEDDSGSECSADRDEMAVRVVESPVAVLSGDRAVCAYSPVRFDGTQSSDADGVVNRYQWDFGDGATGGGPTPEHIFTAAGSYRVRLTVTGDQVGDCDYTDFEEITVVVQEAPVVSIEAPEVVALGESVTFRGVAAELHGMHAQTWEWDFGTEGKTGPAVTHVFGQPGRQTVTLTLTTDAKGECQRVVSEKTVLVNQAPVAAVAEPPQASVRELITFDGGDSVDPDGAVVRYDWDFGDGQSGSGVIVHHRYEEGGQYRATLRVQDDSEASNHAATSSVDVVVNASPEAGFSGPAVACPGEEIVLSGGPSSDPDDELYGFHWIFGDGQAAEGAEVLHTFARPGQYQISLWVNDGRRVKNSWQQSSQILPVNERPEAEAGAFRLTCAGEAVELDGTRSRDRDGAIRSYRWSFGDGESASGALVSHVYDAPGRYEAELSVTDDSGSRCEVGTDRTTVRVNAPPNVAFDPAGVGPLFTGGAHDAVLFDASASADSDGDSLHFRWDFGDGTQKEGSRVFHAYRRPGRYELKLTAVDGTGLPCGERTERFSLEVRERDVGED